ncbi:hypothetical protein [Pseudomonas viridiflava]|nr:hypothetical protein [Pseudomonas viridiflava]MDY0915851.1 hypothetical protein [Pseudomonas viridiflava]
MSVTDFLPVRTYRGQARSYGPVFAARQRYVEDVVAPPTEQQCAMNPRT